MLKRIILISFPILLIGAIIFNYTYHYNLKDKTPFNTINYISITGGNDKSIFTIQEKQKIKDIYEYLFNRRCQKVNKLFYSKELPWDGQNMPYIITFSNAKSIYTVILYGDNYLSIGNINYILEDSQFSYKYFESLFK